MIFNHGIIIKNYDFITFLWGVNMNNKVVSFLTFLLIVFTGAILVVSNNYQSKINLAQKSFDLSANFTPFQIPIQINSDKEYKEVISC